MKELIKTTLDDDGNILVSGRELYEGLGVDSNYTTWFERKVEKYGFKEGLDFIPILKESTGGRPKQDHALTLDTAKEMAMTENTDRGREVRRYFIEIEKEHKAQQIKIPTSHRELAKLALAVTEETNQRVDEIDDRVREIEENKLISTEDAAAFNRMVRRRVHSTCKMMKLDGEGKSLLFTSIGADIKKLFKVPHRGRIKDKDYQRAIDFVSNWEPSSVTKAEIEQLSLDIQFEGKDEEE